MTHRMKRYFVHLALDNLYYLIHYIPNNNFLSVLEYRYLINLHDEILL